MLKLIPADVGVTNPPSFSARQRATIGFLTANIHLGSGRALWPGVTDAAEQHDLNYICFPGGGLRVSEGYESQRNVIYDLIDPRRLDGLITWSSAIGGALAPTEVAEFHQRYQPLPMISLAQIVAGVPTLAIDSYTGMREAVVHLIEVHGLRQLAFMRGPANHFFAEERYRAYTDVLAEYGIPLVPELVTRPMSWEAGAEAASVLLDEVQLRPGLDFEAVVAVSDLMALSAMRVFQGRGIQIPQDIAFVGFNDSLEGRLFTPPLTSVVMPFYEQSVRAVAELSARLAGAHIPDQVMLPSKLIVRQSCGCPSEAVGRAALNQPSPRGEDFVRAGATLKTEFMAGLAASDYVSPVLAPRAEKLFDALQADLLAGPQQRFLSELAAVLEEAARHGTDVSDWQDTVSLLRCCVLPGLNAEQRAQAEDLFGQARVLIGEAAQRTQAYRQLQAERQSDMLREIGQALITAFNVEKLADVLAERLPALGIASCYVALYENPALSLEHARLVLAYTERGRVPLDSGGRSFVSRELAPADVLPADRRYSFMLEPLYFREEQIGFALFEIGPRDSTIYEVLRGHISSALKGALLFQEALQARLVAEKADQVKTRLLTNVSHELRTPLNIILGYTRNALLASQPDGLLLPAAVLNDLRHIQSSAEHQLRVINDLLDLSRAEIDELDLYLELIDPRPLLEDAFHSLADVADPARGVTWQLQLPDRLPWLNADAVRLRQMLLNLLSNARKFTEQGSITLRADVVPPYLHLHVADTGIGIPPDQLDHIFEPFITAEHDRQVGVPPQVGVPSVMGGIGLGLSITRHLVILHGGSISVDSEPGQGSTFHIYLPLPRVSDQPAQAAVPVQPVLLLLSTAVQPAHEIVEFARQQDLAILRLRTGDDLESVLSACQPIALAWDLVDAGPSDWSMVRRLRNHPRLSRTPFMLYGQASPDETGEAALAIGLTSFVGKPADRQALLDAIHISFPIEASGSILIVDDDLQVCAAYQVLVAQTFPRYVVQVAHDGAAAMEIMAVEIPALVILDLVMPGMGGAEVLDRMRADPRLRQVPVVILSSKLLNLDDVKRIEQHARVTLHSKGVLSDEETATALNRALFGGEALPPHTSALVKRALAYLQQHYARPLARWEIAEAVGVSEDYLSRVFSRELGLTPWDYLNRYRIQRAKELLHRTNDSIRAIAHQVGFKDQAYFSRVFRKQTGTSPNEFRGTTETQA
ncbi:two-component system, NarL family, sensor histidine kinase EvgS [Thermoflexales bacterium]|nr:two-component system, NarL family, sensor histidine kinase EvgS [Thermoflexales bacterium]